MTQRYRDYTFTLAADVSQPVHVAGDYIQILQSSANIQITLDTADVITRAQGTGTPANYKSLTLLSTVNQTVILGLGFVGNKPPYDNRFTTGGAISVNATDVQPNTNSDYADVSVPSVTKANIAPSDLQRQGVWVSIKSTEANEVRIGGNSSDATHGAILEPGDRVFFPGTDALYAYNPGGVAVNVTLFPQKTV